MRLKKNLVLILSIFIYLFYQTKKILERKFDAFVLKFMLHLFKKNNFIFFIILNKKCNPFKDIIVNPLVHSYGSSSTTKLIFNCKPNDFINIRDA